MKDRARSLVRGDAAPVSPSKRSPEIRRGVLFALGLCAFTGTMAGCQPTICECTKPAEAPKPPPPPATEYVLVEYSGTGEYGTAPKVEIRDTPKYQQVRAKVHSVAIRQPDSCLNETASKVIGLGQGTQAILQTTCGPWLSELEKALATAGFQVYSWDALGKLEKERNLSTYTAGKQLGADVVFVFNSLEVLPIEAGATSQGRYRYFSSNERGIALAPQPLDEATRERFRGFAQGVLSKLVRPGQVTALSSIIDATAVLTESGESVWFYRRAVTVPVQESGGMKFLFGRFKEGGDWTSVAPDAPSGLLGSPTAPTPTLSAEDRVGASVGPGADPYKAERLELSRTGAREFVNAFKGGTP